MKSPAVAVAEALRKVREETHAPYWGQNHDDLEAVRIAMGMSVPEFREALPPPHVHKMIPQSHCPWCGADVPDVDAHITICSYRR